MGRSGIVVGGRRAVAEGSAKAKLTAIEVRTPDPVLIRHLEKLLDYVKTGELTGLAYVSVWQGNNVNSSWCQMKFDYLRTVLGEMDFLRRDLIEAERNG